MSSKMDMSHQLFFEVMLIKWKAGGKRVFRSAHLYLSYTFVVLTCLQQIQDESLMQTHQ